MRKRYLIALPFLMVSAYLLFSSYQTTLRIQRLEYSPLPGGEMIGDLYRNEIASDISTLRTQATITAIAGLLVLIAGLAIVAFFGRRKSVAIVPT